MATTTAIVTSAPANGRIGVHLAGSDTPDTIACTRAVGSVAQVGDQVLVTSEGRQMWATGVLGAARAAVVGDEKLSLPGSPERATEVTGTDALNPVWAGTWDGSWRFDLPDVGCGANPAWGVFAVRSGAAFWGPALRGYGTLTSAKLQIRRNEGGIFAAQILPMRLLAGNGDRPAAYPSVLATADGPAIAVGQTVDWQIPSAWLPRLGPGGDAGGIGTGNGTQNPYMRVAGPRITFDWKRTT